MVHKKLSDTATEADWSFLDIPGLNAALKKEAEIVAAKYKLDSEDIHQESLLDMAVRPASVASALAAGSDPVRLLAYRAHVIMVDRAQAQVRHDHVDYPADDIWFDGNEG